MVVIDDVQLLADKPAADTWLTHLLDHRSHHQRTTIITSNGLIANLSLSYRLRSRLSSGLCVRLALPIAATRKRFVLAALKDFDITLISLEIDHFVELTAGKTLRQIRADVISLKTNKGAITFSKQNNLVPSRSEFILKLMKTTARMFGIRLNDLKGSSRRKNVVFARAVAMFLIRERVAISLADIGRHFRYRDHTTVRHACKKIRLLLAEHPVVGREAISSICWSLDVELPSCCFSSGEENCA